MSSKTSKNSAKVMDVTKPKKAASRASSPSIEIQDRSIISHDDDIKVSKPIDGPAMDAQSEVSTAPTLSSAKRTIIKPLDADEKPETTPEPDQPEADKPAPAPEVDAAPVPESEAEESTAPNQPKESTTPGDKPAATPEPEPAAPVAPIDDSAGAPASKQTRETRKAVEEAAKAAERERELEKLIDSKHYNVPINAIARKRSIKVSLGLTLLVLLLALVLVDLMLDSDMILLVQKIPHTHFFTSN